MKKFIQSWLINTLAVLVAVHIVHGIRYENWLYLLLASLVLGILNAFLRPLLLFLALPLLIFTLGLFMFFINALLLYFVGYLLQPHFFVDSFSAAFWGALVISVVSLILNTLTGTGSARIRVQHRRRPPDDRGNGPVIDI
ncbi:MAG TPA: phage holin family protein [Verrucomicrobiae bacterium]